MCCPWPRRQRCSGAETGEHDPSPCSAQSALCPVLQMAQKPPARTARPRCGPGCPGCPPGWASGGRPEGRWKLGGDDGDDGVWAAWGSADASCFPSAAVSARPLVVLRLARSRAPPGSISLVQGKLGCLEGTPPPNPLDPNAVPPPLSISHPLTPPATPKDNPPERAESRQEPASCESLQVARMV